MSNKSRYELPRRRYHNRRRTDLTNRLQMNDTLKAPIIEMGRNLGVVENYDLGAGPIHVCWTFKPGSESLPDIRLGFICIPEEVSNRSKRS